MKRPHHHPVIPLLIIALPWVVILSVAHHYKIR